MVVLILETVLTIMVVQVDVVEEVLVGMRIHQGQEHIQVVQQTMQEQLVLVMLGVMVITHLAPIYCQEEVVEVLVL